MKTYFVCLDEETQGYYEKLACLCQRPVEEILSDTLKKTYEITARHLPYAETQGRKRFTGF